MIDGHGAYTTLQCSDYDDNDDFSNDHSDHYDHDVNGVYLEP